MDEITERYDRISAAFTERVRNVPEGAWDSPSPCEGWTARDVVGHLTEWIPGFFGEHGVAFPEIPSVAEDPSGAWDAVHATIAGALADPEQAARMVETPFHTMSLAETVDMIVTGDVFTHTWDLARATGQDERLDPDQVERMMAGMSSMPDEVLRSGGMFGPAVEVSDDADAQTRFLAFVGRRAEPEA
jgi:uncharacterized protein (TIGR03086 family)